MREKDRRIYYQNIVYAVCDELQKLDSMGITAGTFEYPSDAVQKKVAELVVEMKKIRCTCEIEFNSEYIKKHYPPNQDNGGISN